MLKMVQVYITDKDNELLKRAISSLTYYQKHVDNTDIDLYNDIECLKMLYQDFDEAIKENK